MTCVTINGRDIQLLCLSELKNNKNRAEKFSQYVQFVGAAVQTLFLSPAGISRCGDVSESREGKTVEKKPQRIFPARL